MSDEDSNDPPPHPDPNGWRFPCEVCGALTTDGVLRRCASCALRSPDPYE